MNGFYSQPCADRFGILNGGDQSRASHMQDKRPPHCTLTLLHQDSAHSSMQAELLKDPELLKMSTQRLGGKKKEILYLQHGRPQSSHQMYTLRRPQPWPSAAHPHHHHRDVVGRAPLYRLVGQPVAGCLVAGVHGRLPLPALDLLILMGSKVR